MKDHYTYQGALEASERINWRVEDIIGGAKRLDFSKPFMPESLAQMKGLSFLSLEEKRVLNHIRGHEYLAMFGLVEEFILPFAIDHAQAELSGNDYRVRALLQFAGESQISHCSRPFARVRSRHGSPASSWDRPRCEEVCSIEQSLASG